MEQKTKQELINEEFLRVYRELCRVYQCAVVPKDSDGFEPNLHDSLMVVPIDDEYVQRYVDHRIYARDDSND